MLIIIGAGQMILQYLLHGSPCYGEGKHSVIGLKDDFKIMPVCLYAPGYNGAGRKGLSPYQYGWM
ncbi:MAG: hypothetical protein AAB276_01430 [Pseudomonadota bacterium]